MGVGSKPDKYVANQTVVSKTGDKYHRPHVIGATLEKIKGITNINPLKTFHFYEDCGAAYHVLWSNRSFVQGSLKTCDGRPIILSDESPVMALEI